MKFGPVTKPDRKNKTTSKKFDDDVKFGAIQKPDFAGIVCKTFMFINSNLSSYKNWKQNQ